jgi:hypothetical protein
MYILFYDFKSTCNKEYKLQHMYDYHCVIYCQLLIVYS